MKEQHLRLPRNMTFFHRSYFTPLARPFFVVAIVNIQVIALLAFCAAVPNASALPPQEKFVRISTTDTGASKALEVAISDYQIGGKTVSLVSAIHVADKDYYDQLNGMFKNYDLVLYELVAPKGVKPDPHVKRAGFLNWLQETFAKLLQVSLQLEEVDYSPNNFVHADASFDELIAEGERRGETLFSFLLKVISDIFRAQEALQNVPFQPKNQADALAVYFNPQRRREFLAQSLAFFSEKSGLPGLEALEPYILDFRNARVLEVLKEQLKRRKKKSYAIFYGAAHMPDLEKRIIAELHAERLDTEWIPAWKLASDTPLAVDQN